MFGLLLLITVVIVVVGAAAVVVVPASLVIIVMVLMRPAGAGAHVRQWRLFQRTKGLEARRGRATFVAMLVLYGVLMPSFCFSILLSAVRNGGGATAVSSGAAATSPSASVTATGPPQPSATSVAPPPPPPPEPTQAPPAPAPVDPCHVNGVSYCVLNPAVTQATISSTICVSGWTRTVRPPASYTENLKQEQIAAEGLPGGLSSYEEDHRMALELGGAPSDVGNLSPEAPPSPNPKDAAENTLKREVCAGQLTLAQAQQQLVATWLAAYPGYQR